MEVFAGEAGLHFVQLADGRERLTAADARELLAVRPKVWTL